MQYLRLFDQQNTAALQGSHKAYTVTSQKTKNTEYQAAFPVLFYISNGNLQVGNLGLWSFFFSKCQSIHIRFYIFLFIFEFCINIENT